MKRRVFFSWQSDLPSSRNRNLIEDALDLAVKAIRNDDSIKVEPVVDRDTAGVGGTPDIAGTITDKIDNSHVFVADVSIINPSAEGRLTPNPNVLFELGYAVRALGWNRVLLVLNTKYGGPESLPFDLRSRRTMTYASGLDEAPAAERKKLATQLEAALRSIFAGIDKQEVDDLVLQLVGEMVKTDTDDYGRAAIQHTGIFLHDAIKKAEEYGLTADQVEEGLEILAKQGHFESKYYNGGLLSYTFTVPGFHHYATKYVQGYEQFLHDVAVQIITHDLSSASDIRAAVNQPPALIEQALDYFQLRGFIKLVKAFGSGDGGLQGISVMTVSAELKRLVREAEGS